MEEETKTNKCYEPIKEALSEGYVIWTYPCLKINFPKINCKFEVL